MIENIERKLKYNPDTGVMVWLIGRRKGLPAGNKLPSGYIQVQIQGKNYYLHRLAFLLMGEQLPKEVDHIDRNRENNKWSNLRPTTHRENCCNKINSNPYPGVHYNKQHNQWVASYYSNGSEKTRSFSVRKYSTSAFALAVKARRELEKEYG